MKIPQKDFESPEDYLAFVDSFVSLLDQQMKLVELRVTDPEQVRDVIFQMPAIISLVNTVGYLRGQDGMFFDVRPATYGPNPLYGYEGHFETRLYHLIEKILNSAEKNEYIDRLEKYFIQARTLREPRDIEFEINFLT